MYTIPFFLGYGDIVQHCLCFTKVGCTVAQVLFIYFFTLKAKCQKEIKGTSRNVKLNLPVSFMKRNYSIREYSLKVYLSNSVIGFIIPYIVHTHIHTHTHTNTQTHTHTHNGLTSQ